MTVEEMRKEIEFTFGRGSSWDLQTRMASDSYVPILFDVMMHSKKAELQKEIKKLQKELDRLENL